jgi:hypothetical protein
MLFEVLIAFEVLVPFWLEELETEMDSIFPLKKVGRTCIGMFLQAENDL